MKPKLKRLNANDNAGKRKAESDDEIPHSLLKRAKKFQFKGLQEKLDTVKVNYHQHLVQDFSQLSGTALRKNGFDEEYDDLTLERDESQSTFIVSKHGLLDYNDVYEDANNVHKVKSAFGVPTTALSDLQIQAPDEVDGQKMTHLTSTYTQNALLELRVRFSGARFGSLGFALKSIVAPLPILLMSRIAIEKEIVKALAPEEGSLATDVAITQTANEVEPILILASAFCRDLGDQVSISFILDLLRNTCRIISLARGQEAASIIELVFSNLSGIMYHCRRLIVQHLDAFTELFTNDFILHPRQAVRDYAAESMAALLRPLDVGAAGEGLVVEYASHGMLWCLEKLWSKVENAQEEKTQAVSDAGSDEEDEDEEDEDEVSGDEKSSAELEVYSSDKRLADRQRMLNYLSVTSLEICKSVDHSVNMSKFEALAAFWYRQCHLVATKHNVKLAQWNWQCQSFTDPLFRVVFVTRLFVSRVKTHLSDWTNVQLDQIVSSLFQVSESMSEAMADNEAALIDLVNVIVFPAMICDTPQLHNLYLAEDRSALRQCPRRVLDAVRESLLRLRDISWTCFVLQQLNVTLNARALSEWLLDEDCTKLLQLPQDLGLTGDDETQRMTLNILSLLFRQQSNQAAGFAEVEMDLDQPAYKMNKDAFVYPGVVEKLIPVLTSALVKCDASIPTARIAPLAAFLSRAEHVSLPERVVKDWMKRGLLLETFSLSSTSTQKIDKAQKDFVLQSVVSLFKTRSKEDLADPIVYSKVACLMVLLGGVEENVLQMARLLLDDLAGITSRGWLPYVLEVFRDQSNLAALKCCLTEEEREQLAYSLLPTLQSPLLRSQIAALDILIQLKPSVDANEISARKKKRRDGDAIDKAIVEQLAAIEGLVDTIFSQCRDLLTTADAIDTGRFKANLIGDIAKTCCQIQSGYLSVTGITTKLSRYVGYVAFYLLASQTMSRFAILTAPAVKAVVEVYKSLAQMPKMKNSMLNVLCSCVEHCTVETVKESQPHLHVSGEVHHRDEPVLMDAKKRKKAKTRVEFMLIIEAMERHRSRMFQNCDRPQHLLSLTQKLEGSTFRSPAARIASFAQLLTEVVSSLTPKEKTEACLDKQHSVPDFLSKWILILSLCATEDPSLTSANMEEMIYAASALPVDQVQNVRRSVLISLLVTYLKLMTAIAPLTDGVSVATLERLETVASAAAFNLFCIPHNALQSTLLDTLVKLKLSNDQAPALTEFSRLSNEVVSELLHITTASNKAFKSKLRGHGRSLEQVSVTSSDLISKILVQLAYSYLAERRISKRDRKAIRNQQHLILASLSDHNVGRLIALMFGNLLQATDESRGQTRHLANVEIVTLLDKLLDERDASRIEMRLGKTIHFWIKEQAHLTLQFRPVMSGAEDSPGAISPGRMILRIRAFQKLFNKVVTRYRTHMQSYLPVVYILLGALCTHIDGIDTSTEEQLRSAQRVFRDCVTLFKTLLNVYPDERELHLSLYAKVKPVLYETIDYNICTPGALYASAPLSFIADVVFNPDHRYILKHDNRLLAVLLEQVSGANETISEALGRGERAEVVTMTLRAVSCLLTAATGRMSRGEALARSRDAHEKDREDRNQRKLKKKRREQESSSDESDFENYIKAKEVRQIDEIAKELVVTNMQAILKAIKCLLSGNKRSLMTVKAIDLLNMILEETGLIDQADELVLCEVAELLICSLEDLKGVAGKQERRIIPGANALLKILPQYLQAIRHKKIHVPQDLLLFGNESTRDSHPAVRITTTVNSILRHRLKHLESRHTLGRLLVITCLGLYSTRNLNRCLEHLDKDWSPDRVRKAKLDLADVWKGEILDRLPVRKMWQDRPQVARTQVHIALCIYGLNIKGSRSFETEPDAEAFLGVLKMLNLPMGAAFGIKGFTEASHCPTELIIEVARHLVTPSVTDEGVLAGVTKFWDLLFGRVARVGRVGQALTAQNLRFEDLPDNEEKAHWQDEWSLAEATMRLLDQDLLPTMIKRLPQLNNLGQERDNWVQLMHRLSCNIAPHLHFLPTSSASAPFTLLGGQHPEQIAMLESLKLMTIYDVIENAQMSTAASLLDLDQSRKKQRDHLSPLACQSLEKVLSPWRLMEELRAEDKILALKILRAEAPRLDKMLLSQLIIPLVLFDVTQVDPLNLQKPYESSIGTEAILTLMACLKKSSWADLIRTLNALVGTLTKHCQSSHARRNAVTRAVCRTSGVLCAYMGLLKEQDDPMVSKRLWSLKTHVLPRLEGLLKSTDPKRPDVLPSDVIAAILQINHHLPEGDGLKYRLIDMICKSLASKLLSARKSARVSLRFYVESLGVSCLPDLVRQLQSRLQRGIASASLNVAVCQLIKALYPINKTHPSAAVPSKESITALQECLPTVLECIVAELERVADPNDITFAVDKGDKRYLMETRNAKKHQAPELMKVEGPAMLLHAAANLPIDMISQHLLPGIMSLVNHSDIIKKKATLTTTQFSARYLHRVNNMVTAIFGGVEANRLIKPLTKIRFSTMFLKIASCMILEGKSRQEILRDFSSMQVQSLWALLDRAESDAGSDDLFTQSVRAVIKALGLTRPEDEQRVKTKEYQANKDAYFAVQPGAAAGRSLYHGREKRGYEIGLQGVHLGSQALAILEKALAEVGSSDALKDCQPDEASLMVDLVKFLTDVFGCSVEEFIVPAGNALWKIQKLITHRLTHKRTVSEKTSASESWAEIWAALSQKGGSIGRCILNIFRKISSRPTPAQAHQTVICSELVKFYLGNSSREAPLWLMDEIVDANGHVVPDQRMRGALLAHISVVLNSTYHSKYNLVVKTASVQLLAEIMKCIERSVKHEKQWSVTSEDLASLQFTGTELKMIYSLFAEILVIMVRQAKYTESLVNMDTPLIRVARKAYVTFLRTVPSRETVLRRRLVELIALADFEEAEGRRSAMNCLSMLLHPQSGLKIEHVRNLIAETLWVKGGEFYTRTSWNDVDRNMMKLLLTQLLTRLDDPKAIMSLLFTASAILRDNMPGLLILTQLGLKHLSLADFKGISIDEATKPLIWTVGAIQMSPGGCDTMKSNFVKELSLPTAAAASRQLMLAISSLECVGAIFLQPCSKVKSWVAQQGSKVQWMGVAALAQAIESFVPAAILMNNGKVLGQVARFFEEAIQGNRICLDALTQSYESIDFLSPTPPKASPSKRLQQHLTSTLREALITMESENFFTFYLDGFSDMVLGSVSLSIRN